MTIETTIPLRVGMHDLTYDQRAVWGTCPVCRAQHGERCRADVGIALGVSSAGGPPVDGVHLGRLQAAPARVRIEALP